MITYEALADLAEAKPKFKPDINSKEIVSGYGSLSPYTDPQDNSIVIIKDKSAREEYLRVAPTFSNTCLLVPEKVLEEKEDLALFCAKNSIALLCISDYAKVLSRITSYFYELKFGCLNNMIDGRTLGSADVHPSARIARDVFIGEGCKIEANVYIHSGVRILPKCVIGEGSVIFPNVVIYSYVIIGEDVRVHANAVIGSDGFGYNYSNDEHYKVWHLGGVEVGNRVEIGAGSCIDRGTLLPTVVKDGTKIDNLVQIGHNCEIGENVVLCGHVAIGGSCKIGKGSAFGGCSGSADHVEVGEYSQVAGGGLLSKSFGAQSVVGGYPARPIKEWLRGLASLKHLSKKRS